MKLDPRAPIVRAGDALLGAALVVVVELAVVGGRAWGEFAGSWEVRAAVKQLAPLAWLVVSGAALVGALALALAEASADAPLRKPGAAWALGALGAAFGGAVAFGVSTGRHLAAWPVRAGFVGAVALAAGAAALLLAPRLGRAALRAPRTTALAAAAAIVALELCNRLVLPRLYPAFHLGLCAMAAMLAPAVALLFRADPSWKLRPVVALAMLLLAGGTAQRSAKKLALADNLRLIFLDRAPLLGRGVELASLLAPPPPLDAAPDVEAQAAAKPRALDWRGRDIVLVSVDALRADHVGAYGYARKTTPHLDALAEGGVVFEHAYCPTPHTSYSITSLMTGKNMRPLLLQGLGSDSDTFAHLLRTYGYRTAAFYPPAVFFIDEERFAALRDRGLDFEYRKVEFADPHDRAKALTAYLERRRPERRLFVWVHLFEPHEPYVAHPEHAFGDRDVDRYDGEIAFADDGIGEVVAAVRARRPEAIVILTADHGEEFGEHGGRYHGTTVYEEQVRVPLVVSAPGLVDPHRVAAPVQTIDILPTVLAALDIPRPARVRGRDLGEAIARGKGPDEAAGGFAFAETEEQTLLAEGSLRLVCQRKVGACSLYDVERDPGEKRDASAPNVERIDAMKKRLRSVEASHGQFELAALRAEGHAWPDAIRRGLAGDGDAAPEVAALLDDADPIFRRKAAEVLFECRRKEAAPQLRLALSRDEDDLVKRWAALALTRLGEGAPRTLDLLDDADLRWRRLAALALAEGGDGRGAAVLVKWWQSEKLPYDRARELLAAFARIRPKEAVVPLARSLDDVRLRPYIADTLGAIGDAAARVPLAERFEGERYEPARVAIAQALVKLGAKYELAPSLARFLGTPDPLPGGLGLAAKAGVLDQLGGPREKALAKLRGGASRGVEIPLFVPRGGNGAGVRILVRGHSTDERPAEVRVGPPLEGFDPPPGRARPKDDDDNGPAVVPEFDPRRVTVVTLAPGAAADRFATASAESGLKAGSFARVVVYASPNAAIEALAVVPLADEVPPPPPEPWAPKAGEGGDADEGND